MVKECWATEKLHGTSAHISWKDGHLHFSSGGEKHERFVSLFDEAKLVEAFTALGHPEIVVYGEAYGGSQQKQAWRYGDELRFCAFEVQIGDAWLSVPNAHDVATKLGLEFVHYVRIPTDLAAIDAERDAPSEQARRNGVVGDQPREGVVLRPIEEMLDHRGERIICKHKRDEERETNTPRRVVDPSKIEALKGAEAIATEWVTATRLDHVLDKLRVDGADVGIDRMREVISGMMEDVFREGAGEVVDSREARSAVGKATANLFKQRLKSALYEGVAA